MASGTNSPSKSTQALSERSSNIRSPMKSPSKIALPPSPVPSSFKNKKPATNANAEEQEKMSTSSQIVQEHSLPHVAPLKPALVHKMSDAHSPGQTYVSPSDNILSPATKKLTEVKGRRFASSKKHLLYNSSNLFAKQTLQAKDDNREGGS